MRHLGNYALVPERGAGLECSACQVSWIGCAAACECPECGQAQDWWEVSSVKAILTRYSEADIDTALDGAQYAEEPVTAGRRAGMSVFLCRRAGASEWNAHQVQLIRYADAAADYARQLINDDPELARTFLDDGATIQIKRGGSKGHREIRFEMRLEPVFDMKLEKVLNCEESES